MINFKNLQLINPIIRAVTEAGYSQPTEVQNFVIPHILKGDDMLVSAPKGSGKIAAFALPMLQVLNRNPTEHSRIRVLILASTDELCLEIESKLKVYSKYVTLLQFRLMSGDSGENQISSLKKRVDVLLATPQRLLEMMHKTYINLSKLEMLMLYDADTISRGFFKNEIKRIQILIPENIQSLVFCEDISEDVEKMSSYLLNSPIQISMQDKIIPIQNIKQSIYFVEKRDKANLLIDLMKQNIIKEILVFVQNKYIGDEMLRCLESAGLSVESIYGNKPKSIIDTILNSFEQRKIQVLVTTDIAAKGIQIKYLSDILHYDFSENSSVYVNRIEIIRKLGNKSSCISFCTAEERLSLKNIQNKIGFTIPVAIF